MRIAISVRVALLLCCSAVSIGAWAQGEAFQHGRVLVPDSTIEHPEDVGRRAHTNHVIFLRSSGGTLTVPSGETPGSLACVYGTAQTPTTGCPISKSTALPNGGSGIIAIVDAFDYPTAQNDFDKFSSQFRLPLSTSKVCNGGQPCFVRIYANGVPKKNCGWAQEAALDIEWAHAMAPFAQIVLVEAKSNSFTDLLKAVDIATAYVNAHSTIRVGQVSMSWGGSESKSEATNDSHFNHTGVVYFASSGDTGGATIYPSVSPNVVSAGGTRVNRDANGNFLNETGWSGSGGGPSKYEQRPGYQDAIVTIVGTQRGAPDFSFDADPSTGVSVYDSTSCQGLSGWLVFGGTSVSSPSLAGIVNESGSKYNTSANELNAIYADYATPAKYSSDYRDVTSGTAGSFSAKTDWDFVTGVGSDIGTNGK